MKSNRRKFINHLPLLVVGLLAGKSAEGSENNTVKRVGENEAKESLLTTLLSRSGENTFSVLQSDGHTRLEGDRIITDIVQYIPYTGTDPAALIDYLPVNGTTIWKPSAEAMNIELYFESSNMPELASAINERGFALVQRKGGKMRSLKVENVDDISVEDRENGLFVIHIGEELWAARLEEIYS